MTLSSLQKALETTKDQSKSQIQTSKGEFESCFAGGLDLSEFGNSTQQKPKSAAAELLRIRAEEKKQRQKNQMAEQRMEQIIKQRVSNLESALSKQPKSDSVLVDALVKMHGQDVSAPTYRRKKTGPRKSGSSRNMQTKSKPHKIKKSRRSKY